jgi:hypothetical protein
MKSNMNEDVILTDSEIKSLQKEGLSPKPKGSGIRNFLTGFNKTAETITAYGTDRYGRKIGEGTRDTSYSPPPTEVKILGMPPLVFALVSLTVVVSLGVAIAKIGNKSIAK